MKLVADTVLKGGQVITWCEDEPRAEAVAMAHGRILAVGDASDVEDLIGPDTRVVDVDGRVVLPGFTDAHSHLASEARRLTYLDLSEASSLEDFKRRVQRAAESLKTGEWVLGRRWDESRWPLPVYPTREDLDSVGHRHPVALARVDGHMTIVNSRALKELPPEIAARSERDIAGNSLGVFKEEAADRVWEEVGRGSELLEGIPKMVRRAHRLGVTSIHDVVDSREASAYARLHRSGSLKLRVNLMPLARGLPVLLETGLWSGFGDHTLRLGPLKAYLDGSLGARTARLASDYEDEEGTRGTLMPWEELTSLVREASRGQFQLALHAIGDEAIELGLRALSKGDYEGWRHRVEHFELPTVEHLRVGRRLGIIASMQPNFIGQWSRPGGMYERRLGAARLRRNNPFRQILDVGLTLAFGSDHMPFAPLYGVHWAVNAPFEEQRLSVEEALRCYTQTAAYASFEEDVKGTVEPGRLADLVVLEKDPFKVPERIEAIRVHMTIFNGKVIYERS